MKSENNQNNMDIEDPKQDSSKRCHNMDPKHQKLLIGLIIFVASIVLIIGIVVGTSGTTGTTGIERMEGMLLTFPNSPYPCNLSFLKFHH